MANVAKGTFTIANGNISFDGKVSIDTDAKNIGKNIRFTGTYSPQQRDQDPFYNSTLTYNDIGDVKGPLGFTGHIYNDKVVINLDNTITITSSKASIAVSADITGSGNGSVY